MWGKVGGVAKGQGETEEIGGKKGRPRTEVAQARRHYRLMLVLMRFRVMVGVIVPTHCPDERHGCAGVPGNQRARADAHAHSGATVSVVGACFFIL